MHDYTIITYLESLLHQSIKKKFLFIFHFWALVKSLIYGNKCLTIFFSSCVELFWDNKSCHDFRNKRFEHLSSLISKWLTPHGLLYNVNKKE